MDTLNTKRETQVVKSSVVDIPWANSFQQTLIVALLRFYKHLRKTVSFVQVLTAIYFVIVCAYFTLPLLLVLVPFKFFSFKNSYFSNKVRNFRFYCEMVSCFIKHTQK